MNNKKLVLAFSGGADSTVLLHKAANQGYDVYSVGFDYDQRHKRESDCVIMQLTDIYNKYNKEVTHKFIDVKYIKDISPNSSLTNSNIPNPDISKMAGDAQPTSYVPFRNLMFLSICCSYAESIGATEVWYGATGVDSMAGYWDADKYFIQQANTLIGLNRKHQIKIIAPLINMDKADIIREGVRLGVNFGRTWSCYASDEADITTPSSSLRVKGFINAKYIDPIYYVQQTKLNQLYEEHDCKRIPGNSYDERIIHA